MRKHACILTQVCMPLPALTAIQMAATLLLSSSGRDGGMTTAKNSASQKETEAVKDVTVTVSLNSNSFIFPAGMCLV